MYSNDAEVEWTYRIPFDWLSTRQMTAEQFQHQMGQGTFLLRRLVARVIPELNVNGNEALHLEVRVNGAIDTYEDQLDPL